MLIWIISPVLLSIHILQTSFCKRGSCRCCLPIDSGKVLVLLERISTSPSRWGRARWRGRGWRRIARMRAPWCYPSSTLHNAKWFIKWRIQPIGINFCQSIGDAMSNDLHGDFQLSNWPPPKEDGIKDEPIFSLFGYTIESPLPTPSDY